MPQEANRDESSIGSLSIGLLVGFGQLQIPAEERQGEESEVEYVRSVTPGAGHLPPAVSLILGSFLHMRQALSVSAIPPSLSLPSDLG